MAMSGCAPKKWRNAVVPHFCAPTIAKSSRGRAGGAARWRPARAVTEAACRPRHKSLMFASKDWNRSRSDSKVCCATVSLAARSNWTRRDVGMSNATRIICSNDAASSRATRQLRRCWQKPRLPTQSSVTVTQPLAIASNAGR